jgi:hypothetical protein
VFGLQLWHWKLEAEHKFFCLGLFWNSQAWSLRTSREAEVIFLLL